MWPVFPVMFVPDQKGRPDGAGKLVKPESRQYPLAMGVIVLTVLALSLGDAPIKLTSGNFVIWQI